MSNTVYILRTQGKDKKALSKRAYDLVLSVAKEKFKDSEKLEIGRLNNGKPYLKKYPDFHFNISHSQNMIAVAFAETPVGVDIEVLRDVNLKIAERYFSKEEKDFSNDTKGFFYVWTRKEAYLKMTGEGLGKNLSSFNTLQNKTIKTFNMKDYIVSVCNEHSEDFTFIY